MALFALRRSGCRRAPGPPESWRDWPPRRGSARRLRLHVAEHRLQAEQAGIAQGAQFVEADAGGISMPRSRRRGAGPAPARWHGRRALAPTVEALPLMVCRVAALPGHRPRRAGVRAGRRGPACPERAPQHLDDQLGLPPKRPTISPRASTSSPASAAVAGAPGAAPAEMTEQAKHQALLVDRLRHMVVHARRQAASRSASEALAVMARIGSPAKRRRRGFSGSPRDHRYPASACPSAPRRTARSPPAPAERPPARRRRGHPGALAAQQLGGDWRFSALSSTTSRRTPARWVRSTGRGGGLARAPCSPCNACSTESASCLGVTGLVRKSTKGGALWSRAVANARP